MSFERNDARDRGISWEVVDTVENAAGSSQSDYWTGTKPETSSARVRVTADVDPSISDLNDAEIRIAEAFANVILPGGTAPEEPDENCVTRAFLWEHVVMQDLGTLPSGAFSAALAINNRGEIVGASDTARRGASHAFLWRNGTMIDLGTLAGSMSSVARSASATAR